MRYSNTLFYHKKGGKPMVAQEIIKLEQENTVLRRALEEIGNKIEQNKVLKPKSCQYCKNYIQHYIKGGEGSTSEYVSIYDGHCVSGVPIKKGGKRNPKPDDTCPYFELGTTELRYV